MATLKTKKSRNKAGRLYYYACFYDPQCNPPEKWITLRATRQDLARQNLARLEWEQAQGLFDPWEDKPQSDSSGLEDVIPRYLSRRKKTGREVRSKTKKEDAKVIRSFFDTLGSSDLKQASRSRVFLSSEKGTI